MLVPASAETVPLQDQSHLAVESEKQGEVASAETPRTSRRLAEQQKTQSTIQKAFGLPTTHSSEYRTVSGLFIFAFF
jgi:hypothetical protein